MSNYTAPSLNKKAFTCPYCNAYSHQRIDTIVVAHSHHSLILNTESDLIQANNLHQGGSNTTTCQHCHKSMLWISNELIYPITSKYTPNPDLNDDIKVIFKEANNIYDLSPRASCVLLRLCLEKLCLQLGCSSSKTLNENILALSEKHRFNDILIQSFEYVRVMGNSVVHPKEVQETDNKEIASTLFKLINEIAEQLLTKPRELKEKFSRDIPQSNKDQINKKHNKDYK